MITIYILKATILMFIVSISVYFDVKKFKIPNKITLSGVIFGLVINSVFYGLEGLKVSLVGMITPFILLFILYALKMLGAGDVKLFCAIGSIMGFNFILNCMAYSMLGGGVIALIFMIARKNFIERLKYLFGYFKHCLLTVKIHPYQEFDEKNTGIFRFSYAIFIGTLSALI